MLIGVLCKTRSDETRVAATPGCGHPAARARLGNRQWSPAPVGVGLSHTAYAEAGAVLGDGWGPDVELSVAVLSLDHSGHRQDGGCRRQRRRHQAGPGVARMLGSIAQDVAQRASYHVNVAHTHKR